METFTNANGNQVTREFEPADRYLYDRMLERHGFEQFDTDEDAEYFGIWVSRERGLVFSYIEGDCTTVVCPDDAHFLAEIRSLSCAHPKVASFASTIDEGHVTRYFAERPHEQAAIDAAPAPGLGEESRPGV